MKYHEDYTLIIKHLCRFNPNVAFVQSQTTAMVLNTLLNRLPRIDHLHISKTGTIFRGVIYRYKYLGGLVVTVMYEVLFAFACDITSILYQLTCFTSPPLQVSSR